MKKIDKTTIVAAAIGLVIAIGLTCYFYSNTKEREEQLKRADEYGRWVEEADKNLEKDYLDASIEAGGFKPVKINDNNN